MAKQSYPSEHVEQATFVNWFRIQHSHALIFSIPNGELRAISVANRLKAEGVLSGIPDLCCIFENSKIVWIEMKKEKGGTISKPQKEIHKKMGDLGQNIIVGYGWIDAKEKLQNFLNN